MNDIPIIQQDDIASPATNGAFPSGIRFGLNGALDASDMFKRALGSSEQLPPSAEYPEEAIPGVSAITFAFKGKKSADLEVSIQKGEVELGPATVLTDAGACLINGASVASGRFTNNLTSAGWFATPTAGSTTWFVWAEVDIRENEGSSVYPSWTLNEGASITALEPESGADARNIKWTRQKKILIIALVDDKITTVKNLQCGNIDIPRL